MLSGGHPLHKKRNFQFLRLQKQKQRLAELNLQQPNDMDEFKMIINVANEILNATEAAARDSLALGVNR